ncbi:MULTISPECIES: hypothetical protein [unclassified Nonomuraea]|uniref:hypothetical protein n=1 Tax=unclassified Nonomuraea TaxID=2593643 RepID=UPI0033C8F6AC
MMSTNWPVYSPFARQHFGRGRAEGLEEGRAEGIEEGRAEAAAETGREFVLYALEARGVDVPEDVRARINACTDVDLLKRWALRGSSVRSARDVFDEWDGQRP